MEYEQINETFERVKTEMSERGYCVHAVADTYKDNPMISDWVNVHTHGLEKYNLTNISIVTPENDNRLAHVIYTVANMMKNGEEFAMNATHFIDNLDGSCDFKFRMLPTKCYGEDTIRIILPDPVTNKFSNEDNMESVYCLQTTTIFECCEEANY